jgi:very-short-patch-repair endonuclease
MRAVLAARRGAWSPPASGLEGRVARLLERHGLPRFERQIDLGGDRWVGRVDFVNRAERLVLEVQSNRYHSALSDRRADAERSRTLRAAGWRVLEVWESEVWSEDLAWLDRLRAALASSAVA